jgi:hypothetical protein
MAGPYIRAATLQGEEDISLMTIHATEFQI